MNKIDSLSPIADKNSKILILGSIPGKQSLEKQQYYGNNRNAFWKIIYTLFGGEYKDEYEEKIKFAKKNNIALWDVIENCNREDSLDSNIKNENPNDFESFLKQYPNIKHVFFNGAKAYDVFKKKVGFDRFKHITFEKLTSTSPANTISFDRKLEEWKKIKKLDIS